MSDLENGKRIPNDALLTAILKASGFSMSASSSGQALARLLAAIRDNEAAIAGIKKDTPK